jgi:hypothetical protein
MKIGSWTGLAVALTTLAAACGRGNDGEGATGADDAALHHHHDSGASSSSGSSSGGARDASAPDVDASDGNDAPDASAPDSNAPVDANHPDASGNPDTGVVGAPTKIVGGYYPNWTPSPVRIRDVDPHYNLIYLFSATPVGGAPGTTGAVTWDAPGDGRGAATNLVADIAYARATQGRKIILSIGGAGNGMSFPNRTKSQTFVDSVIGIVDGLGGIDGMDWNTFEGSQAPDASEMIWISQQLKSHYPGFMITAPPAPWNQVDKTFCTQMVQAGAIDYCAPQYYDGPDLAVPSYIESSVDEWTQLLGEEHVVVGFGVWDQPNYISADDAVTTWKAIAASHPKVKGAFDWQVHTDEAAGWPFAQRVGPLVTP